VEELPPDTSAAVWVEPGMVSTQGREPGGERRAVYAFDTFPALRVVGLSCTANPKQTITEKGLQPVEASGIHPRRRKRFSRL